MRNANVYPAPSRIRCVRAHLTGDFSTLLSSPREVAPAPGAGSYLNFVSASMVFVVGSMIYNPNSGSLATGLLCLGNTDNLVMPAGVGFIDGNDGSNGASVLGGGGANYFWQSVSGPGLGGVPPENLPLVVSALGDASSFNGSVVAADVADGGADYVVGDTGHLDNGVGQPQATYEVTAVDVDGAVTAFDVTYGGNLHYSSRMGDNPYPTFNDTGAGSGLTVTVTETPAPDGELFVASYFTIERLP